MITVFFTKRHIPFSIHVPEVKDIITSGGVVSTLSHSSQTGVMQFLPELAYRSRCWGQRGALSRRRDGLDSKRAYPAHPVAEFRGAPNYYDKCWRVIKREIILFTSLRHSVDFFNYALLYYYTNPRITLIKI